MEHFSGFDRHQAEQSNVRLDACIRRQIGIVVFAGFDLTDAATIVEAFQSANSINDAARTHEARYDVRLLSVEGGTVLCSSGVSVWTESMGSGARPGHFHALFVGGGAGVCSVLRDEHVIAWLRRACPRSGSIFPIAEGRLLLDAAGLGYATGGLLYDESRREVVRNGLRVRTTPHSSDPLRAALATIENDFGSEVARQITGGVEFRSEAQSPACVYENASANVSERIRASVQWLEMNSIHPIAMDEAAQVAAMSERNFLRRFKMEMGMTPSDYLLRVRLDMCCRLLAETSLPVEKIARRCGIGSGGQLSKIFNRHLGVTPTEYRASNTRSTHPRTNALKRLAPDASFLSP